MIGTGRRLAALILLALTGLPQASGASLEEAGAVQSGYAQVVADPPVRSKAPEVAALINETVPRVAAVVGATDLQPIAVYLHADRRSMLEGTGVPLESEVVGLTSFRSGTIQLDGSERLAKLTKVVPHEVAHVLVARLLGPQALPALPLWVSEGISEYAAGTEASQVDPIWVRALSEGESLRVAELDEAIAAHGDGAGLAYAEAASLVRFLVAKRGEGVISELLRSLRLTHDFGAALRETAGWSVDELEEAWRGETIRQWRWPLLFESQAVWFGLMVLLFLAGLARYLRERRRRQESAEEDW
ncbi:MAG: peptidase MA family metallohydrolase [Armatimonadota bacterium]